MQTQPELPEQNPPPENPTTFQERGKAWRIVAVVLTLHAVVLGSVVLIQGCGQGSGVQVTELAPGEHPETTLGSNDPLSSSASTATVEPGKELLTPEETVSSSSEISYTFPQEEKEDMATRPLTVEPKTKEMVKQEVDLSQKKMTEVSNSTAERITTATSPKTPILIKYTVQKGDTLSKIAKRYTVSTREIVAANHLPVDGVLKIGQKISVPSKENAKEDTKIIVKNEAIKKIASPSKGLGQLEKVSKAIRKEALPLQPAEIASSKNKTYMVRTGETLSSIARKFGVELKTLLQANQISDPRKIKVNQKLIIPIARNQKTAEITRPVSNPILPVERVSSAPIPSTEEAIGMQDGFIEGT